MHKYSKEEIRLIHFIINIDATNRHLHVLKQALERQLKNPTPTRQKNITRTINNLCNEFPDLVTQIYERAGMTYQEVDAIVKKSFKDQQAN